MSSQTQLGLKLICSTEASATKDTFVLLSVLVGHDRFDAGMRGIIAL
jgi:hypothetical protein